MRISVRAGIIDGYRMTIPWSNKETVADSFGAALDEPHAPWRHVVQVVGKRCRRR